ncbi:MAG: ribulokinase [Tannerellaceae bacterium]|jgi:L-ribulokinase|nr:ribulokinase [Tannerellaceae bacterium]
MNENYVIGVDYGTDSVRALLVDADSGKELALGVKEYPRWKQNLYCDPIHFQFRHHPLDYIETLEYIIEDVLTQVPGAKNKVRALAIDVTCSTPIAVDKKGIPLALHTEFAENPNAMFVLWKDHTGVEDCNHINSFSQKWAIDYTKYSGGGGNYSAEHFWTKVLHVLRVDEKVREAAHSFVEACDWLPAMLTGKIIPEELKRNMCTAGFKVFWNKEWGGYPPNDFFKALDPVLDGIVDTFSKEVYTCDQPIGTLDCEWANRLGLNKDTIVAVGNVDAHSGGIGAGVRNKAVVQIIGTSTCNILVGPKNNNRLIPGISGQADDSVIPGMIGYEAGQAAYGDLYAWFKRILMWPTNNILANSTKIDEKTKKELIDEIYSEMIPNLARQAKVIPAEDSYIIATDWINGRRTPDVDYDLKCSIAGLTLSSTAPLIYKALVESTAFGARAIIEQFINNGIEIEEIIGVGGITQKSPYVMQVLSDVLGKTIKVIETREACALGVAICAAVAAGIYPNIQEAQDVICMKVTKCYTPNESSHQYYSQQYKKYNEMEKIKQLIE